MCAGSTARMSNHQIRRRVRRRAHRRIAVGGQKVEIGCTAGVNGNPIPLSRQEPSPIDIPDRIAVNVRRTVAESEGSAAPRNLPPILENGEASPLISTVTSYTNHWSW